MLDIYEISASVSCSVSENCLRMLTQHELQGLLTPRRRSESDIIVQALGGLRPLSQNKMFYSRRLPIDEQIVLS